MFRGDGSSLMAILIDFQKVREDSQEVEYIFGWAEEMDRRLVIRKASLESTPEDGKTDGQYSRALRKIMAYFETEASWPDKGSYSA